VHWRSWKYPLKSKLLTIPQSLYLSIDFFISIYNIILLVINLPIKSPMKNTLSVNLSSVIFCLSVSPLGIKKYYYR
jgi:hypothetical protein